MTEANSLELIKIGESTTVEFKKSTNEITKDVYDTVCSFSNRDGGHIFLGVEDNGLIIGIVPEALDQMKKDFVTAVNNSNKIYPPMYLTPEEIRIEERIILHIYVPVGTQVCRHNGKIFDRSHEADLDITNNSDSVYRLYARKQDSYYVNKVTGFGLSDLRSDLIDRARKMSRIRNMNHPWLTMGDEEFLRSAGLILKDDEKHREGITLAAILLFGEDITIMSALPQHKTDAIFRVENVDRYGFQSFSKNPAISKVFRETSLADELGSGMRNTYKYTKLYSGGTPEFIEGNVFKTMIPLTAVSVGKVGPSHSNLVTDQVTDQVTRNVDGIEMEQEVSQQILDFCQIERSKKEICEYMRYRNRTFFTRKYLFPLIQEGKLQMTKPDKPNSRNQKYIAVKYQKE